jgi:NAD(P)-dependent dehydrogenase (short-subunit alcohol dehydrogenase family)
MKKQLAGKVAIVTGASRGIGRAISIALAKEAATVVLAARAIDKMNETAKLVTAAGGKAQIIPTELTDEVSIKNLVKATGERFGRLAAN